jgi:hypothetical protein
MNVANICRRTHEITVP